MTSTKDPEIHKQKHMRRPRPWRHCLAFAALLLLWSQLGGPMGCGIKPCYYCGSYYDFGTTFKSFDLCNDCRCIQDSVTKLGRVECSTQFSCAGYCYWEGKKYSSKQTFQLRGECVRCNCRPGYYKRFDKCGGVTFCLALERCSEE